MTLVEKSFFSLFTCHFSLQPPAGWPYEEGTAEKYEMRRWGDCVRGRREETKFNIKRWLGKKVL
jgi:hypothetical protein